MTTALIIASHVSYPGEYFQLHLRALGFFLWSFNKEKCVILFFLSWRLEHPFAEVFSNKYFRAGIFVGPLALFQFISSQSFPTLSFTVYRANSTWIMWGLGLFPAGRLRQEAQKAGMRCTLSIAYMSDCCALTNDRKSQSYYKWTKTGTHNVTFWEASLEYLCDICWFRLEEYSQ